MEDNVNPNAVCQDITVQLDASGNVSIVGTQVDGGSSDACGIASFDVSPSTFTCANIGANTVTLTVTDNNGNTDNCTATVTVEDNIAPIITCPADIVVANIAGTCGNTVNYTLPTATDNCGIASIIQTAGLPSGSVFPPNTTTNTFEVTDVNGNTATCSFDVTVNQNYELVYSTTQFREAYITAASGAISNSITINSRFCDVFAGTIGEDYVQTGKVTVTNVPNGLTASIKKVSNTELHFALLGNADPHTAAESIGNLTVIFNDAAFSGALAANVINSARTDLQVIFLDLVPLNLQSDGISTSEIKLYWDENTGYEGFRLYRGITRIADLPSTATQYIDNNLDADTFYSYHIFGMINGTEIAISRTTDWTYPLPPMLISSGKVCESGQAMVTLNSSAFIYNIYADETSITPLMTSDGSEMFLFPSVNETTTFYVSVIGKDPLELKESARIAVTVEVKSAFEAAILGEQTQSSCESNVELIAQEVEGATYRWLMNGNYTGHTGQSITAQYSGNYQVRIQKGVCTVISDEVNIKLNQQPVVKIEQPNGITFCDRGVINATQTNTDANYEWILNDVVVGEGASLEVSQSGVYTLQITENGCQATSQIEVVVMPTLQAPVLEATSTEICVNTETTLSVQNPENGVTYQWFRNGRNLRKTGTMLSTSMVGSYKVVSISNSSCSISSEELQVSHIEVKPMYIRMSEDKKSLFLEDINGSQNDMANVEWYFAGEIVTSMQGAITITPTEDGYYSAVITTQNGCQIHTRASYFTVPVVTGEEEVKEGEFAIYPNPNKGLFKVRFPLLTTDEIEMTIFDASGRKIKKQLLEKGKQEFVIDIQGVSKGIYLIKFNQNGSSYSRTIVVQ